MHSSSFANAGLLLSGKPTWHAWAGPTRRFAPLSLPSFTGMYNDTIVLSLGSMHTTYSRSRRSGARLPKNARTRTYVPNNLVYTRVRYSFEGQTTMTYARKQPYRGRPSQSTRGWAGFTWSASRAGECMLRASTCRCPPSNLRALIEGQLIPSHHPRTAHPSIVPSSHRHPPRPPRHFSGAGSLARFPRTQPSYEDRKIGPRRPCAGLRPAAAHGGGRVS